MTPPCTFGIEEEYLLVDLSSGRVPVTPSLTVTRRCREVLGKHFTEEMFRSQVEVVSPVLASTGEAREFFTLSRHSLQQALAAEGIGLYGAASHPNAPWLKHKPRSSAHYRQ
ncbi:MAG TPA: carboxylate-amine ligase, partial [Pseudomonas sp.]|nr:carboxylate-amine ligase [Pseudomonas sp.]